MKKTLFTLVFLCLATFATAQERKEIGFKIALGDTLIWAPYDSCDTIKYSTRFPKNIDFKLINFGERVQVIAKRTGNSWVTAKCSSADTIFVANITIFDPNAPVETVIIPKNPGTQPFTGVYKFNPPTDNFFITINDQGTQFNETYMKHGDEEAFNDGQGIDRFWNVKTGKNWYYKPDAQGWTDDVDWEFEPFGESFPIINAFANEVNHDNLSNYYVGNETLTVGNSEKPSDINCWHFFVDSPDGNVIQYWVDPANGCTLKRQINNEPPKVVTVYDLNYTRLYFGPSFKKGLHDTTR